MKKATLILAAIALLTSCKKDGKLTYRIERDSTYTQVIDVQYTDQNGEPQYLETINSDPWEISIPFQKGDQAHLKAVINAPIDGDGIEGVILWNDEIIKSDVTGDELNITVEAR